MRKNSLRLYVHIPFCVKKCNYCSFVSWELKEQAFLDVYLDFLEKELFLYKKRLRLTPLTIYIGGGTPSLLPPSLLEKMGEILRKYVDFSYVSEFTIEANPESIDKNKVRIWKKLGINRVSLGVQAFDDKILSFLGRVHRSIQTFKAIEILKEEFENISFDLIYGIPGQDLKKWEDTLTKAITFKPKHISMYALSFDDGTLLRKWLEEGKLFPVDEEQYVNMYKRGVEILYDNGYQRYEISNFSYPGYESIHNLGYWTYDDYVGIGVSASSFLNGERYTNFSDFKKYRDTLLSMKLPIESYDRIDKNTKMGEYAILRLRTKRGLVRREFLSLFGIFPCDIFGDLFSYFSSLGYMERTNDGWRLTDDGILISNRIFMEFLR